MFLVEPEVVYFCIYIWDGEADNIIMFVCLCVLCTLYSVLIMLCVPMLKLFLLFLGIIANACLWHSPGLISTGGRVNYFVET